MTIQTDHGQMVVDLAVFFPTSLSRVRKLFRLIQTGMPDLEQESIRRYLTSRKSIAAAGAQHEREQLPDLEAYLQELDVKLDHLKRQRENTKKRISDSRTKLRVAEQVEKMSDVWVEEFERICGKEAQDGKTGSNAGRPE